MEAKEGESTQVQSFKFLAHSIQGKRHRCEELPCQDAFASCMNPQGFIVMAVADGVSQSPSSEIASRNAVEAICNYWHGLMLKYQEPADIMCLMKTAFNFAAAQSKSEENVHQLPMGYETTLQVCLVIPEKFLITAWCGDGGGYALFSDGRVEPLMEVQRSDDGSVVTLCSDPDNWRYSIIDANGLHTVIMVTDGINDVILCSEDPTETIDCLLNMVSGEGRFADRVEQKMRENPFETVQDDITIAALTTSFCESMEPSDELTVDGIITNEGITEREKRPRRQNVFQWALWKRIICHLRTLWKRGTESE